MNELVSAYRNAHPDDTRSDEELLLEASQKAPELLEMFPDAKQDLAAIKRSITPLGEEFASGLSRGIAGAKSSLAGAGAMAAQATGLDSLKNYFRDKYKEYSRDAELDQPTTTLEDVNSPSTAVHWLASASGEVLPSIAEAVGIAIAGGMAGSAAAPGPGTVGGTVGGAATGIFARQAIRQIIKEAAEGMLTKRAIASLGVETAGEAAGLGVKEAAKRLIASDAGKELLAGRIKAIAQTTGTAITSSLNSMAMESGEKYGNLIDDGVPEDKALNIALTGGLIAAIPDTFVPSYVASKVFKNNVGRELAKNEKRGFYGYLTRLIEEGAKTAPAEAGTEAFQEYVGIAAQHYAKGGPLPSWSDLTDQEKSQIINAGALGAVGGAITAPVAAIHSDAADLPETKAKKPKETTATATGKTEAINPALAYELPDSVRAELQQLAQRQVDGADGADFIAQVMQSTAAAPNPAEASARTKLYSELVQELSNKKSEAEGDAAFDAVASAAVEQKPKEGENNGKVKEELQKEEVLNTSPSAPAVNEPAAPTPPPPTAPAEPAPAPAPAQAVQREGSQVWDVINPDGSTMTAWFDKGLGQWTVNTGEELKQLTADESKAMGLPEAQQPAPAAPAPAPTPTRIDPVAAAAAASKVEVAPKEEVAPAPKPVPEPATPEAGNNDAVNNVMGLVTEAKAALERHNAELAQNTGEKAFEKLAAGGAKALRAVLKKRAEFIKRAGNRNLTVTEEQLDQRFPLPEKIYELPDTDREAVMGLGQKLSPLFEETNSVDDVYTDANFTESAKEKGGSKSRKLVVLQGKDGSYVVASVYSNGTGENRRKITWGNKGTPIKNVLDAGWKIVGAIKTDFPNPNYFAKLNEQQWSGEGGLRQQLLARVEKAKGDFSQVSSDIENSAEFGRKQYSNTPDPNDIQVAKSTGYTGGDEVKTTKVVTTDDGKAMFDELSKMPPESASDIVAAIENSIRAMQGFGRVAQLMLDSGAKDIKVAATAAAELIYDTYRKNSKSREGFAESIASEASRVDGGSAKQGGGQVQAEGLATGATRDNAADNRAAAGAAESGGRAKGNEARADAAQAAQAKTSPARSLIAILGEVGPPDVEEAVNMVQEAVQLLPMSEAAALVRTFNGDLQELGEAVYEAYKSKDPAAKLEEFSNPKKWIRNRKVDSEIIRIIDYIREAGSKLSKYGVPLFAPEAGGLIPLMKERPASEFVMLANHLGYDTEKAFAIAAQNQIIDDNKTYDSDWYHPRHGELLRDWSKRTSFKNLEDFDTRQLVEDKETGMLTRVGDDPGKKLNKVVGWDSGDYKFVSVDSGANLSGDESEQPIERLQQEAVGEAGADREVNAAEVVQRSAGAARKAAIQQQPNENWQSPRSRVALNKYVRAKEEQSLLEFARKNGLLAAWSEWRKRWKKHGEHSGAEHEVIPPEPELGRNTWLKLNAASGQGEFVGGSHDTWSDYFVRLALHRLYFPETAYKLLGFIHAPKSEDLAAVNDWENGKYVPATKGADAKLYALVEQPDIHGERGATREEVMADMKRRGFEPIQPHNKSSHDYYNPKTGVLIGDIHNENAVIHNGDVIIFDPIIELAKPHMFEPGGQLARFNKPERFPTPDDFLPPPKDVARKRVAESKPSAPVLLSKFRKATESLRAIGIDPKMVSRIVGELSTELGKYEEWKSFKGKLTRVITVALADAVNPTAEDFITLLHETGHAVMAREDVVRQAQIVEAIANLSNSQLGIDEDFKEHVDKDVDAAEKRSIEVEGRTVQSVAEDLAAKGWDPVQAATVFQTIIRMAKNAYYAVLMKLAKFCNVNISSKTALAYVSNRVQMTLAGDFSRSFMSWLGGTRMRFNDGDGPALHQMLSDARSLILNKPKQYLGKQVREIASLVAAEKIPSVMELDGDMAEKSLISQINDSSSRPLRNFGITVNLANPDPVTQRQARLTNPVMARIKHAVTRENRVDYSESKVQFAPFVSNTIRQADLLIENTLPNTTAKGHSFLKLYDVNGKRVWHVVELEPGGGLLTQYSLSDANIFDTPRIAKGVVKAVGPRLAKDAAPAIGTPAVGVGSKELTLPGPPSFTETSGASQAPSQFQNAGNGVFVIGSPDEQNNSSTGVNYMGRYRRIDTTNNPDFVVSPDIDSGAVNSIRVAAHNAVKDWLMAGYQEWNPSGLTFEQWLRNGTFVDINAAQYQGERIYQVGPAEKIAEGNALMQRAGLNPINPELRLADLSSESARKQAAAIAYGILRQLEAERSKRHTLTKNQMESKLARLKGQEESIRIMMKDRTNADLYLDSIRTFGRRAKRELERAVQGIADLARKSGVLETTIQAIEGGELQPEMLRVYQKAIDSLSDKLTYGEGQKFTDQLEEISKLEQINWNAKPREIIDVLRTVFEGDPLVGELLKDTVDAKARLAVAIAYGKDNQAAMELLAQRTSQQHEELAKVNEALKRIMDGTQSGINEARQIVMSVARRMPRALRILEAFDQLRREHGALRDEIHRDKSFLAWSELAGPRMNKVNAKLEAAIGVTEDDWQPTHNATYLVPEGNQWVQKKLNLKAGGAALSQDIRGDMAKMLSWLDGHSAEDYGRRWFEVKQQYDRLALHDIEHGLHRGIQKSLVARLLAPMPERLRRIGTPLGRDLGAMIFQLDAWQRSAQEKAHELGYRWQISEGAAMESLGIHDVFAFRTKIFQPMMNYLERNRSRLIALGDDSKATELAVREVMAMLRADPTLSDKVDVAANAIERYVRATTEAASWQYRNGVAMGNKVRDDGFYREAIGQAPFTVMRSSSKASLRWFEQMQKLGWDDILSSLHSENPNLAKYFQGDVWNWFRAIAHRSGEAAFQKPVLDGRRASRENVIKAFESVEHGDIDGFARKLWELEGGDPRQFATEYSDDVVDTLHSFYEMLRGWHAEEAEAERTGIPSVGRFLVDKRKSEESPAEFLDYLPYDSSTLRRVAKAQAYQAAMGRDLSLWRKNMAAAKAEQSDLVQMYSQLEEMVGALPHKASRKQIEEMRQYAETMFPGVPWEAIKNSRQNRLTLDSVDAGINSMLTMYMNRPPEIEPWTELIGALSGFTVMGPATALTDTIAMVEQPLRKFGVSRQALDMITGNFASYGAAQLNSFLQVFGKQIGSDAEYVKRLNALGYIDSDAFMSLKDKASAIFGEESLAGNFAGRAAQRAARAIKLGLSTGAGRANEGMAAYQTFKPQSVFGWSAQGVRIATAIQWVRHFEGLVGKAILHFQSNPEDLANGKFEFTPEQLGMKAGRAFDEYKHSLMRYGLSVEQIARDAMARREKVPTAPLLDAKQVRQIVTLSENAITLEGGPTTRLQWLSTTALGQIVNPLVGWALSKAFNDVSAFREPSGQLTLKGFRSALAALGMVLPVALAYALMRDWYDEDIIGRKQNVRDLGNVTNARDAYITMLDNLARVGTFGVFGEIGNSMFNPESVRPISLDNRIFFVASTLNTFNALRTWAQQGTADYATVGRPLAQALGGSGMLQYVDTLNHFFAADNAESRVIARTNVGNYLRVAGRELGMDVRTARGMAAMPTPTKPFVGQMVMAAYANDAAGFQQAYKSALEAAAAEGRTLSEAKDYVARSYQAYNPVRLVFRTPPNEAELNRVYSTIGNHASVVRESIRLFEHYGEQVRR